MAKRQRGGARPGQRAPLQRGSQAAATPSAKPVATPRPSGLSTDELDRAAELEAQIVADERAATSSLARGRRRTGSDAAAGSRNRTSGSLAVAAEEEYRYVMRDLRRIVVVFAGIFAILIASWLLVIAVVLPD